MKFIGYDGEIELINGAVIIKKGKKDAGRTIRLTDIISVTLIKPTFVVAGCIYLQVVGGKEYRSVGLNTIHYAADVNAICFRKPLYDDAVKFKAALDNAIAEKGKQDTESHIDIDGLRQLKQLVDDGVISQEDFEKKKAQMLGL